MQQTFPAGSFNAGLEGHPGGCDQGQGRGGQSCTPFADYMQTLRAVPTMPGQIVPCGGGIALPVVQQQICNPDFSNVYKWYNKWNVCFSCGFNVENGHMTLTCPFKKLNHQQRYRRENVQQFVAVGYDPCTRGIHKTVLPLGRNT